MFVKPCIMLVLVSNVCLFMNVQGKENSSNFTNAKVSCNIRGGLITQEFCKYDGLMNTTCDLGVNTGMLKDGESVWIQGQAKTGPYIALYTCLGFSNQDKQGFAINRTFHTNILYECSVFCDKILKSTGYLGIYKDSCLCMYDSFRFPHTPECLEHDFMDIHKNIIVFRLIVNHMFDVNSKSANFNCIGTSFHEDRTTSYYNTKCSSTLYSICTQRVDSDLSSNCVPHQGEFCFKKENRTFLEHYRNCWFNNGTLIPFVSDITSLNYSVILGSFRVFKPYENKGENNDNATWSCLSITQFNGTIYLETENCSNENAFICMDEIQGSDTKKFGQTHTETMVYVLTTLAVIVFIAAIIVVIRFTLLKILDACRDTLQRINLQANEQESHLLSEG